MKHWPALLALGVVVLSACALTGKGEALTPRYFSADLSTTRSPAAAQPFELRLGEVASAAHLDERISYRVNPSELGFYDDRRWTEVPDAYLRRALERDLFEARKLSRVVTGAAPTLDVELTAFEELRGTPTRARVSLTFSLRDDRHALLERSVDLVREVSGTSGDPAQNLAQALALTLNEAVKTVSTDVVDALSHLQTPR